MTGCATDFQAFSWEKAVEGRWAFHAESESWREAARRSLKTEMNS
jgi:hypothetical protein